VKLFWNRILDGAIEVDLKLGLMVMNSVRRILTEEDMKGRKRCGGDLYV
jgi:hypothetical protein